MRHFVVMCDSNDADYITDVVSVSEEDVEKFMPIIEAIENYVPCPYGFGLDYHNWDSMRPDLHDNVGTQDCFERYSQFSKEYIDEFFETFLIGCTPEWACGDDMIHSIHTIYKIQEITLGKEFIAEDYQKLENRAKTDKRVQEYLKIKEELKSYTNSEGKNICEIKFTDMTPEEYAIYEEYKNLWREYR